MSLEQNKLNALSGINVNNFSDYDLDYIRMQIKKNSESLERSIENLKRIANRREAESMLEKAESN